MAGFFYRFPQAFRWNANWFDPLASYQPDVPMGHGFGRNARFFFILSLTNQICRLDIKILDILLDRIYLFKGIVPAERLVGRR